MKLIPLALALLMSASSCGQAKTKSLENKGNARTVPASVQTRDSIYWTFSTLSNIGYVNTTPGAYYNTYQGGGGMIARFKFKENNQYEFMLYVKANTYGYVNETWTHVEGTAEFTKDSKGQNVVVTKPVKGIYRINKNGEHSKRSITKDELKNQHTTTYLWERSELAGDEKNTYLLLVDLNSHPDADVNDPKSIDPSWVSKFLVQKSDL